jgi:hypothetical protein
MIKARTKNAIKIDGKFFTRSEIEMQRRNVRMECTFVISLIFVKRDCREVLPV